MRLPTLIISIMLASTALYAPRSSLAAPSPESPAKRKLEELKKKMPEALTAWHRKQNLIGLANPEWLEIKDWTIKVCRMTSSIKAKITFHGVNEHLGRADITLYLRYVDGLWTTTRCEGRGNEDFKVSLMLAIDKAAEKK